MRRCSSKACALAFVGATTLAGCAVIDSSVAPRSATVNQSSDDALNDGVLLNIIRAANSEPLNFISLNSYNAQGQMQLNSNIFQVTYPVDNLNPQPTYGPIALNTQAQGQFGLQNLESSAFYTGMLRPLSGGTMRLWLSQGLPHELVFLVMLKSIRITMSNGHVFEYRNDPTDNKWYGKYGPIASQQCRPPPIPGGLNQKYGLSRAIWVGVHRDDCGYWKFRFLIDLAVKYGLSLETIQVPNPNAKKNNKAPATIAVDQTCYDPAIARENLHGAPLPPLSVCGRNRPNNRRGRFNVRPIGKFHGVELVTRSPFAIFQYLGRILRTNTMSLVTLGTREERSLREGSRQLLTIKTSAGVGCFASAWYRGQSYCVPAKKSANTKLIFTMLRALIASNTSELAIAGPATVRVAP